MVLQKANFTIVFKLACSTPAIHSYKGSKYNLTLVDIACPLPTDGISDSLEYAGLF